MSHNQPMKVHEVTIDGLQPQTTYRYQIQSGSLIVSSTFKTAPAQNDPFTFVAYGDNRSYPKIHRQIAEGMLDASPDLIIHTGDLVANGKKYKQWGEQFFTPLADVINHIPIFPSIGNHDKNADYYHAFFSLPDNGTKKFREAWYSFDYGDAHFVALDSNREYKPDSIQTKWLEKDLAASRATWKFVFFHHPLYSSGEHKSSLKHRDAWAKLFMKYGVDIVFNGHEHIYERTYPIASISDPSLKPVAYVVTGGGGAELHKTKPQLWTAHSESTHHFIVGEVNDNTLKLTAYNAAHQIIDTATFIKPKGSVVSPYPANFIPYEQIELERQLVANAKPFDLGYYDSGTSISERLQVDITNSLETPADFEVHWNISNAHWRIEPSRQKLTMAAQARHAFPFQVQCDADGLYPIPTFSIIYQMGNWNGRVQTPAIRVGPKRTITCKSKTHGTEMTGGELKPDGYRSEAFWREASVIQEPFVISSGDNLTQVQTTVKVLGGRDAFYFAFICAETGPEPLYAYRPERFDTRDDYVGVYIAPEVGSGNVYFFATNYQAHRFDRTGKNQKWDGAWEVATTPEGVRWTAAFAIPYKTLGLARQPRPGETMGINFVRHTGDTYSELSEWSPTYAAPFNPKRLGTLHISGTR
ncbi:metallophosphoesterase [Candidatus Poribacteria bacterium]|nr:metallophosphoesterase [Candidatus Poribacteria bacterium]